MALIILDRLMELNEQEQTTLLGLARLAIVHGLNTNTRLNLVSGEYPERLHAIQSSFVTLEKKGYLRGCIGSLEAHRPLYEDVANHAYAASFSDPRFPKLTQQEYSQVQLSISILSPPEIMEVNSEEELIQNVRPGIDGLILSDASHRGTFLPSVWEQITSPEAFISELKLKAGFSKEYWSSEIFVHRYTTQYIQENP